MSAIEATRNRWKLNGALCVSGILLGFDRRQDENNSFGRMARPDEIVLLLPLPATTISLFAPDPLRRNPHPQDQPDAEN